MCVLEGMSECACVSGCLVCMCVCVCVFVFECVCLCVCVFRQSPSLPNGLRYAQFLHSNIKQSKELKMESKNNRNHMNRNHITSTIVLTIS